MIIIDKWEKDLNRFSLNIGVISLKKKFKKNSYLNKKPQMNATIQED